MRRKSFAESSCPIARSLERIGEWWSILIIREALRGATRFDEFQEGLGIAPNMLTRRLRALVDAGLLEKRQYSQRPPRSEYILTERGQDFRPVLWALLDYGNRHFAPEGPSVVLVDTQTGATAKPILVDSVSGVAMESPRFSTRTGPASKKVAGGRGMARIAAERQAVGE